MNAPEQRDTSPAQRLPVRTYLLIVVGYLAVGQGLGHALTRGRRLSHPTPPDLDAMWRMLTVPVTATLLFTVAVITALRWWRPVWHDDRPVRSWVIIVPIVMVVSIVLATDYGGLADRGAVFTLLLLLSTMLIGFSEELMFRGVGVVTFRSSGCREGSVALWSTIIFGVAHLANLPSEGLRTLVQVIATIIAGYFLYLIRRRTGGILAAALVHGGWDFSLISDGVAGGQPRGLPIVAIGAMIVLAVVVLVGRKRITPPQ
ncbi:type II CAAX prenyl endopeptidase Rce1 family protein [Micromonospora sp. NPDC002575]|uniref:CPBP family glutamic-type intramembrane protease n=1 Tax=Micromonospora sp. NPDC002575 TaxID=3364222 RepID=UPI0036A38053